MRQTEAERLLTIILQVQMDIETIRRRLQINSPVTIGSDDVTDEDLRLACSLLARAGDNLVPLARESRKPIYRSISERVRRIFEHV